MLEQLHDGSGYCVGVVLVKLIEEALLPLDQRIGTRRGSRAARFRHPQQVG
ncbi:hypothetical protein AB0H12_35510 [Actinosynnema sp. NPDC023794]